MKKANKYALEIFMWIMCILYFAPILFFLMNTFKDFREILLTPASLPVSLNLDNYIQIWNMIDYPAVFFNSLFVSSLSTLLVIVLGSMAGYKLSRMKSITSAIFVGLFLLALMIPFQMIMIPIAVMAKTLEFKNNLLALVIINCGYTCSLAILMYHGFVKSIPLAIEESALIDGCSVYKMYFKIIFPMLKPVTGTLIVIYIIRYWNDLILPLTLITKQQLHTIPLSQLILYGEFTNNRWNLLLASGALAVIPVFILYIFSQKFIIKGIVAGAVKG